MANIKSIGGNPIVVPTAGIEDGAVTDAKLASDVGHPADTAKALNLAASYIDYRDQLTQGFIKTSPSVGSTLDVTDINTNRAWSHVLIPVKAGEEYFISAKTTSQSGSALYVLTDSSYKVLEKARVAANDNITYNVIVSSDGYLVANPRTDAPLYVMRVDRLASKTRALLDVCTDSVALEYEPDGYYALNVGVGNTVDMVNRVSSNTYKQVVCRCHVGDVFTVTGTAGNAPRLWCFTDDSYKVLSVCANGYGTNDPVDVAATSSGYFFSTAEVAYPSSCSLRGLVSTRLVAEDVAVDEQVNLFNDVARLDRYIYSAELGNAFVVGSGELPAHAWDAGNDEYSDMTTAEAYALYDSLITDYPDEMSMQVIGTASDEQDIRAYFFTPLQASSPLVTMRPTVLVTCAHHGWEKAGTETLYMLFKMMLDGWEDHPTLEVLRSDVNWVIVPVANPYGFDNNVRKNANGVDINRNYETGWTENADTTASTYPGTAAESEPETQAIAALMESTDFVLGIDFHDFGSSSSSLMWVTTVTDRVRESHIAVSTIGKTMRRVQARLGYLSAEEPTELGYTSSSNYGGKARDQMETCGAKMAYTFETCGVIGYNSSGKRFDDDHVTMCIEAFANFMAESLEELRRESISFVTATSDQ